MTTINSDSPLRDNTASPYSAYLPSKYPSGIASYLILFLSGAVAGFSFAPLSLGILMAIAFVPLILHLDSMAVTSPAGVSVWRMIRPLYVFFFAFHGASNWWVMSWQKETDPFLMIAGAALWLGHPFFLMPGFLIFGWIRKRASLKFSLMLLPFIFCSIEWLQSFGDLSYPWLAIGYSMVGSESTMLIAQIGDLVGVFGVGLLLMAINAIIAWWVRQHQITIKEAVASCAVLTLVLGYGAYRMYFTPSNSTAKTVRFTVVQPSINPWSKWENSDIMGMTRLHEELQLKAEPSDVALWSETALPIDLNSPEYAGFLQELRSFVDTTNTALITGFADFVEYPKESAPFNAQSHPFNPEIRRTVFNSACIINPIQAPDTELPIHHKSRLTPFGEGVPFADDFPFLRSLLSWGVGISGWNKGSGATVLPLIKSGDTIARIAPVICIESIYPNYVADFTRKGATHLAVITNDAWYDGTFGPRQHFAIAQFRAIESRLPLIRCGNSGISGWIDERGVSRGELPARSKSAQTYSVPYPSLQSATLYVQWGDWISLLSTIIMIAGILYAVRTSRKLTMSQAS
jgi:apolipoprotein N-acyltransferase